MALMKAARLNQWGGSLHLEDIPIPEPNDDEMLIKVHAASINPLDTAVQAGYLQSIAKVPMTLGTDFAGEVTAVGSNISHLEPGNEVYGLSPLGTGAFAEYMLVKAHEVTTKPESLDFISSSSIPLPSMAAWKMLFDLIKLENGERLLIHGVAGNVGSLAVQLAKEKNAFIYGTDIPEKEEHAKNLGVDKFISTEEPFEEVVEDVHAVLDLVGGEIMDRCYNVLDPGGRYVTSLLAETPQEEPKRRGIQSMGLEAWPNANVLEKIKKRIESGKLKTFVNRTFPLEEANQAMTYRLETKKIGKVVLTIH
jgi:NADPH:quinone reductase-like Zn-dependent oxidoreductase